MTRPDCVGTSAPPRYAASGIAAVLVQAKDENAERFYMACAEFIEFPDDSRTLFLPVETLVAAFG